MFGHLFIANLYPTATPMIPSDNTGKVLTRRVRAADGTAVMLHYRTPEAVAMRSLIQSIRIKGDKTPSLSLIARRAMQLYVARLDAARYSLPDVFAAEVAELERMVTPVPKPAQVSRKCRQ